MSNSLIKKTDDSVVTRTREHPIAERTPTVDIGESTNEYVIVMDLPGLVPEDVDITFGSEKLEIKGRSLNETRNDATCLRGERTIADFRRTFDLQGCSIDGQRIAAGYELGVLTIRLPKSESAKARRIEVT